MDNPVRSLREHLGLNQHQFGDLIGRSYPSVQGYEAGKRVPPEIVERLKTIAAERGFADIAVSLTSDDWKVDRVIYPSGHEVRTGPAARPSHNGPDDRDIWHGMLDLAWDARQPESIAAIKSVLLLAKAAAAKRAPAVEEKKKGKHTA